MAAAAAAARSLLRSSPFRRAAASASRPAPRPAAAPFRLPAPAAPRLLRSPAELSVCVESLMPKHSAIATSLMTSMLSLSARSHGWLSEAGNDDV